MSRDLQIDDYISIESGDISTSFIVTKILPDQIYVRSLYNPSEEQKLVKIEDEWTVPDDTSAKVRFASKEEMFPPFTYVADVDMKILNELDDQRLGVICQVNKYAHTLCQKDELWRQRIIKYFPESADMEIYHDYLLSSDRPLKGINWEEYYKSLIGVKDIYTLIIEVREDFPPNIYTFKFFDDMIDYLIKIFYRIIKDMMEEDIRIIRRGRTTFFWNVFEYIIMNSKNIDDATIKKYLKRRFVFKQNRTDFHEFRIAIVSNYIE